VLYVTEPQAVHGRSGRRRPSLADIRRHRDWRYRALLEADPQAPFRKTFYTASALEILAAAKSAGVTIAQPLAQFDKYSRHLSPREGPCNRAPRLRRSRCQSLNRWLMGPHQGGIQRYHLDDDLDEFTFRFNRRRSSARGLLSHRLAQQAVAIGPAPYSKIINDRGSSPKKRVQRGYPVGTKKRRPC
jgi:hypothetical protein